MARWRIGHERIEQLACRCGHPVDGAVESNLVCLGRPSKATQLADELQRRCPNFVLCRWRFEVMKRLDITTHAHPRLIPGTYAFGAVVSKLLLLTRNTTALARCS